MRSRSIMQGLLTLLLSGLVTAAPSVSATFNNSIKYKFDTNGNAIDSTSGKIDFLGGEYVSFLLCYFIFLALSSARLSSRGIHTL
jgi:hypothetical protein